MPRACLVCRRCVECGGPGRPSLPPSGEVTEGQEGVCPLTSDGSVLLLWPRDPAQITALGTRSSPTLLSRPASAGCLSEPVSVERG